MEFQRDEEKRQLLIRQRGVDILYAALIFEGHVLSRLDNRRDYGEERWISLGMVDDECFVVVHTQRGGFTRLITAWKGGRDERSYYQERIARRDPEDEGQG
nr:BrnT family toxin [Rhizobium sp. RU35A]